MTAEHLAVALVVAVGIALVVTTVADLVGVGACTELEVQRRRDDEDRWYR